jgi:hypothetical protein
MMSAMDPNAMNAVEVPTGKRFGKKYQVEQWTTERCLDQMMATWRTRSPQEQRKFQADARDKDYGMNVATGMLSDMCAHSTGLRFPRATWVAFVQHIIELGDDAISTGRPV